MDLIAFIEILRRKYGEDVQLTPGCEYSIEITLEEVISILGEVPETPAVYEVNLRQAINGEYEVIAERYQIN